MFGRIVDLILALVALIGIAVAGGWAVYGGGHSAEKLEQKLEKQASDVLLQSGYEWANVKLDGQHAVLSGRSPGDGAASGAIDSLKAAGLLGGVISGPITGVTDEVLAGAPISPYTWSAEKMPSGQIVLSGYVPDRATIEALVIDAEAMAPGEVDNRLQVGNGAPRGDWMTTAHKALLELEHFEHGRVQLIDAALTIEGLVMSPEYRAKIRKGLSGLDENYSLETDVRGAGLWSASINSGTLTLDGVVNSEAERAEILALIQAEFVGPVVDQIAIRPHGHDEWLSGVRLILPQFLRFRSGFFTFDPEGEGYQVSGEAAGSAVAFLKQDAAQVSVYPVAVDTVSIEEVVAEVAELDFSADQLSACQAGFKAVLASNRINFASGKADIDRSSGVALDKLVSVARRCDGLIFQVGGHTDSAGDRGRNITLSRARAEAVADYMTARGIAGDQIDAIGFGPDVPIADNATQNGRAANRRIEFKVIEGG